MIKKFVLTRETFSGYEICRSYTHIEIYWITPIHWLMRINEINYNYMYLSHWQRAALGQICRWIVVL